jgi:enoyl-CoA hydratase
MCRAHRGEPTCIFSPDAAEPYESNECLHPRSSGPVSVMQAENVRHARQDDGLLIVTIDRAAKRNALDGDTLRRIGAIFAEAADDTRVKLAVLTSAGEKSFAAGGDLRELSGIRDLEGATEMSIATRGILERIRSFPVPVVAALNGDALGGGAELAVACDLRMAAAHARIGFIQARLAITTAWGGFYDLTVLVGVARALSLLCRSEMVAAEEAKTIGLVDHVAAVEHPFDVAMHEYCQPMLNKPRHVLAALKKMTQARRGAMPREQFQGLETKLFAQCWIDEAHWRAAAAALPRRGP